MALVREEALKTITDGLSWLAMECKLRGLLHLFDSNTISHELFRRLLNEVYDLSLVQTDHIKVNFPAIDLGDEVNKRCFQITTEKDGAKVQNTLDTFAEHRLGDRYGRLQVLVIGEKQRGYKSVKVPPALTFDPDADILELGDLVKLIEALSTEKLTRLAEIVRAEVKTSPTHHLPNSLHRIIDLLTKYHCALGRVHQANTNEARLTSLAEWRSCHPAVWESSSVRDDTIRKLADPAKEWLSQIKCPYVHAEDFDLVEEGAYILSGFAVSSSPMSMPDVYSKTYSTEDELWQRWNRQSDQLMALGGLIARLKELAARAGQKWNPSPQAK